MSAHVFSVVHLGGVSVAGYNNLQIKLIRLIIWSYMVLIRRDDRPIWFDKFIKHFRASSFKTCLISIALFVLIKRCCLSACVARMLKMMPSRFVTAQYAASRCFSMTAYLQAAKLHITIGRSVLVL